MTTAIALAPSPTTIVPAVPTPLDAGTAATHLRAWPETDGNSGPLFLALVFVETGGGRSTKGHNPGNVTADDRRYNGEAWRPDWYELGPAPSPQLKALHDRMLAGQAPRAFRSYSDFGAGFSDLAEQLRRNFRSVLEAARSGNARDFVDALSERYSRDYNANHYKTFESLQSKFQPLFADLPRAAGGASMRGRASDLLLPIIAVYALIKLTKGRPKWQAY